MTANASISACTTAIDRTRSLQLVIKRDRQFANSRKAKRARNSEELQVERIPLDDQERDHLFGHLAAKDLDPDLRIPNIQRSKMRTYC